MNTADLFRDARVERVRELSARLREALAAKTEAENALASAEARAAEIALALYDIRAASLASPQARMTAIDGHNLLFAAKGMTSDPAVERERRLALVEEMRAFARRSPKEDFIWLVFDGSIAGGEADGNFRISYTGGEGGHRADRILCSYLRAARLAGASAKFRVVTSDSRFAREARKLGAETVSSKDFAKEAGL